MSDGPSGPNIDTSFLYRQSMQGGGGGGSSILPGGALGLLKDVQLTNFKLPGGIMNADATIIRQPQKQPGLPGKLLADMGLTGPAILDGMKQVAQAGPVQQASIEQITGSSHGLNGGGGGFVASLSRGGGDDGVGVG